MATSAQAFSPAVDYLRALIVASHPGPCLAITALTTILAAEAAPHGTGPVLLAPAMLAGQLSLAATPLIRVPARNADMGIVSSVIRCSVQ